MHFQSKRNNKEATVPSTIGEEKKVNPFMRVELVFYINYYFTIY